MKLLIVGTLFGSSGYANHCRNLCNELYNQGIDVALETQLFNGWERQVNDNELKMIKNNKDNYDALMLVTLPTAAPLYWHTDKPIYQWCVFEGDKIPKSWCKILLDDKIKYILVPSQHTRTAIRNTITEFNSFEKVLDKIKVIPHGVNLNEFKQLPKQNNRPFTFLIDGGWVQGTLDRKGISFAVKAFAEEFKEKEAVKLLVKVNTAYPIDKNLFDKYIAEINIQNPQKPNIEFVIQNLTIEQLNTLYNTADVYLICSLAEGFHIGGLQAMACGLPIIYTPFGGHIDYCNESIGWGLKQGNLFEVTYDVLYEGIRWHRVSVQELRGVLRDIYTKKNIADKSKWALELVKNYTWANTVKKLINLF